MSGRFEGQLWQSGQPRRRGRGSLRALVGTLLLVVSVLQPAAVLADPASPVSVVKTADKSTVASGDQLTYTIVITNLGGAKVDNVVMTDQVNGVGVIQNPPALPQLTITSSKGNCTQGGPNGNVVTCNLGTLAGREAVTITIRGQVTAANGTVLNNTASVTGTKSAQTFTTTGSVNVLVSGGTGGGNLPDLTINKTGPTSVDQGANLTYTLTVNNIGTANTADVKVVDTLPAGVTLQPASATTPFETTSLFTCTSDAPADPITVTCVGGAVNQGQNATIKIHAVAPASGDKITNTSVVDPDNAIAESNELNNTSASVNTSLAGPPAPSPISIVKTDNNPNTYPWSSGAGPDPVNPGELLTYKILVTNEASSRADDVRISDTTQGLEASSLIVSQVVTDGRIGTGRGCVVNAPEVICSVQSLNAGGTILMTITGLVIAPAGSNLFNTATVHGNVKNVGYTNTSSESTTVRPSIDLNIVKTDSPDPACARTWPTTDPNQHLPNAPQGLAPAAGSIPNDPGLAGPNDGLLASPVCLGGLTYRFVVGNSGNGDASNVVVRDPLPAGVIFDSWDTNGNFTCAVNGSNVVTCSGGFIPAAQTRWIELRLVAPPDVGSITNTVYVDPNNAIFEPDETNNTDTQTTTISTGIDLVIWKGDSVDPNPPGIGAPTLIPGTATNLGDGYDPIATRGTQTYTIYVDNVGTQDVTGIRVRDTLPADTIFLSAIADNEHGFTCTHNGAQFGGVVECVGGHLRGTEAEFYDPAGPTNPTLGHDDFATIKIRVFARATVGTMFNEVRVDPLNEIVEVNEQNNVDTETTTVGVGNAGQGAYNQLTIEKKQFDPTGTDPVATNGILIYDLVVSNLGTDPVSAVVVKDTLPSGTRFISAKDTDVGASLSDAFFCSHDGSATGGVLTCFGGDLSGTINKIPDGVAVGPPFVPETRTIRVTVFAPNIPGKIVNIAGVDPDNQIAEGNEFDNDSALETTVRPCTSFADCTATNAFYELKLTKAQTNPAMNPVARNGIVTYTLTVENWGSDPVSGVVVTDRLPSGFRFISAADSAPGEADAFTCTGPDASGVLTCSGGSFDAGLDSRSIIINVFAPDEPGAYTNNAFVDPNNTIPEGNEFNNQASLQTIVANGGNRPYIDLTVDKTQLEALDQDIVDGRVRVVPGGGIAYQLVITNNGEDGDAFNVRVRDFLPANVTFFKAEDLNPGPGAFTCGQLPGQPNTIDCVGGTVLQDGGTRTINVIAVAPTGLDQIASDPGNISQILVNTAFVDPLNEIPEGDEVNNTDSVQTLVQSQINLTVVSKEGPNQANQNQEADYVITVKNEKVWGDGRIAFDAVVVDYLPVGLIPLSVSTNVSNMACQTQENPVNLVTCVGDIEPDQEVEITVHVFITAESGTLDNEACIDPDHLIDETSELDNCKTKTTQVEPPPAPNLNINKNASTGTVTAGEEFSYTVTVANVGNADAPTGITITDPLPSQVTFKSATATNDFDCTHSSGTVTCTDSGSGLAAGQSTVITIEVTVNSGVTGAFTNTATVNEGSGESASVTTNVGGAGIDLILTDISDSPDPANIGQNVTYTFAVSNAGTSPSGAFSFTAKMDTGALNGLKFIGAAASQGFICGDIATDTVTCTGSLLSGQSTNVSLTFQILAGTPTSHTLEVKVDPTDAIVESSELNNDDTEVTTVTGSLCTNCVDLVAGGILDTPDPVAPGGTLTLVATVSNAGDISTAVLGADQAVVWVILDSRVTFDSASATGGFDCTDFLFFGIQVVQCVGDLGPGQGVAVTVNVTADGAADGDTLSNSVLADPFDVFPEGTGSDHEFSNDNNIASTGTSVVDP